MVTRDASDIRRILVALDASGDVRAAIEAAVRLAAGPRAELVGLFIEDLNVLHAAGLPFVAQVNRVTGARESFDPETLERAFRQRAAEAERVLAMSARAARLHYSFTRIRGHAAKELLSASGGADIVVIGKRARASARAGRVIETITTRARVTCVIEDEAPAPARRGILVVDDGSQAARHALRLAMALARPDGAEVTVLIAADDDRMARRLGQHAIERLRAAGIPGRCRRLTRAQPEAIAARARESGAAALILALEVAGLTPERIDRLVRASDCPVLILRPGE